MALNWTLKLKDEMSGPASKADAAMSTLEKRLKAVRKEAERQKRIEDAVAKQLAPRRQLANLAGVELAGVKRLTAAHKGLAVARSAGSRASSFIGGSGAGTELFDRAGSVAGGAALAGVGLAGAGALKLGLMVQDAQQFKSDTMFALTTILKTKEAAAAAFAMGTKTAMDTGVDFRTSMSGFNTLLAQGFDVKFADQLVRAMSDLATINPQANMEGITRAISQIKSTGRLQGDELMQLAEAGMSTEQIYAQIAKSMGIAEKTIVKKGEKITLSVGEQISDLQRDGKISSKVAIDAIMATLKDQVGGKEFGATAKARADGSLKGAAVRALTMKEAFLSSINVDWSPLSRGLERITALMSSPAGDKFAERIGGAFTKVIGLLDDVSDKDMEAFLDGIGNAFTTGAETAREMSSALSQLSSSYSAADAKFESVTGMSIFKATMNSIVFSVQMASAAIDGVGVHLQYMQTIMIGATGLIGAAITNLKGVIIGAFTSIGTTLVPSGGALVDGFIMGITSKFDAVGEVMASLGERAKSALDSAIQVGSPARKFVPAGEWSALGYAGGMERGLPAVEAAASQLGLSSVSSALEAGRRFSSTNNSTSNNSTNASRNFAPGAIVVNASDPARGLEDALRQVAMSL